MATRNIVPRATGEGGLGVTAKRWATAFINAITCTTINALTLAAQSVGFTIAGGTTSKTLTVELDSLVNQDLTSDASPTFAHDHLTDAIADNTATNQGATTAFAKSQDAVLAREPDQGVAMTAAATAGMSVPYASGHIDFGTGSFTLVWKGSLPDWTPSPDARLICKATGATGYHFRVTSTGAIKLDTAAITHTASIANTFVDGTSHEIAAVVTVGSVNTTVDFYVDGLPFGAQQTAANPGTVTSAIALYILGSASVVLPGTVHHALTFNRALTAAEVLGLYRNGITEADKWGSQTSLVTGDNTTFASDTGWWTKGAGTSITGGVGRYTSVSSASGGFSKAGLLLPNKKYRVTYTISGYSTGGIAPTPGGGGTPATTRSANGTYSDEFSTSSTANGIFYMDTNGTTTLDIDNITLVEIGATLALEPEGIQRSGWKDSSTNGLNASYPTTGSSITRTLPLWTDTLLSVTTVSLGADADTNLFTVPTGRRCVPTKAILVVGADAGTSVISIGSDGAETDWIPNNTLSALDAANDAAILMPVPNTTPTLVKSYAGGTVIQAKVSSHAGGATNTLYLFGLLY